MCSMCVNMKVYTEIIVSILITSVTAPSPISTKIYRTDYVYNKKSDAFYKLHLEPTWRTRVDFICNAEGAKLMVPSSQIDLIQLHSMLKQYPDVGEFVWVGVDGQPHDSVDEDIPIFSDIDSNLAKRYECEVVSRNGDKLTTFCFNGFPFICKVSANEAPYDPVCDAYGQNYKYVESIGSCYTIPPLPYSWNEAYSECQAQSAHLAVINSEAERNAVWDVIKAAPRLIRASVNWFFFLGFRADKDATNPRQFMTVQNQTLEEAGYNEWLPNEPNNAKGKEYCGAIFKNAGKFNDVNCDSPLAFVCEKEINRNNT